MKNLEQTLKDAAAELRDQMIASNLKYHLDTLNFVRKRLEKDDVKSEQALSRILANYRHENYRFYVNYRSYTRYIELQPNNTYEKEFLPGYPIKADTEELFLKKATKEADDCIATWISRALSKINPIISGKNYLLTCDTWFKSGAVHCNMKFTLPTGWFTVRTQIVFSHRENSYGVTHFARYPLTFHDVVCLDKKVKPSHAEVLKAFAGKAVAEDNTKGVQVRVFHSQGGFHWEAVGWVKDGVAKVTRCKDPSFPFRSASPELKRKIGELMIAQLAKKD